MCGRFAQKTKPQKLAKKFQIALKLGLEDIEPRFNIAPSSLVPCIRIPLGETKPVMETLKWGLVPTWAKDPTIGFKLANARSETVHELPSFRSAFKKQRCLVPIDGFYEWNQETKPKQPHFFFMKNDEPFCLAGLWEYWDPKDGKTGPLTTFTLITTEPNSVVAKVHDRMPVILDEKDHETWLDPKNQDIEKLRTLLRSFPAAKMGSYPVSTFMSNARNEGAQCLDKVDLPPK